MPSVEELGYSKDGQAEHGNPAQPIRRGDPFSDSEALVAQSGLPSETLIEVGDDHRLADEEPLKSMLEACERLTQT